MTTLPTEMTLLGWSVLLLIVQVFIQAQTSTADRGLDWNAGPRDGEQKPAGLVAGRAARALSNFQETYPAFVALALALTVSGRGGGIGEIGAWTWFAARIVYLPLYLLGVPWLRSVAWFVSVIGLVLMLIRLL